MGNNYKDPKDDQVINKDDSVTNKDGDNNLEKGKMPTQQKDPDDERVPTVTPDNDNGDPGQPADDSSSNKDGGPAKENL